MNDKFAYNFVVEECEEAQEWLDLAQKKVLSLVHEHQYSGLHAPSYLEEARLAISTAKRALDFLEGRYTRWAKEKKELENS